MKRKILLGVSIAALGLAQQPLRAQREVLKPFLTEEEKPVLRAQPVERPRVATPIPSATPIPLPPRARPPVRTTPSPAPAAPPATPVAEPPKVAPDPRTPAASPDDVVDPGGEIRLSPGNTAMSGDQIQLSIADGFFTKKLYNMAAPEYEKYLGMYAGGPDRAAALFRLGESYRLMGSKNAAKSSYETLLTQVTEGEYLGLAAYHLADIYYQEKNFTGALPMYRRASVRLKEPKLTNSAKFFVARCLEALGQKLEARSTYEELVNKAQDNPFADASRLSLAVLLKDAGRTAEALKQVQALAKQTENPELKAEATVRSGLWLLDLNQTAKAEEELRKSFDMPGIGSWKNVAQYGLLQLLFDTGKYQELIDQMKAGGTDFGPEIKPQLLILAAKAQAKLGKSEESLAYFDQLTKEFPDSTFTKEASYERLVALYQAEDKNLVPEIDKYVSANPDSAKLDQVQLMKAEVLFKKQEYAAAAPIYEKLDGSRSLTGAMKGEAAFKLGWCYMQTRDHERAIKAYTGFLERYPTGKSVPAALVQRGLAHLRMKAFTAALKDFDQLITRHPKAKERELALQQKALILGQQNENEKMAEAFQLLLKDYPDTPAAAAAEANYWIGYVAFGNKDYKAATLHLEKARELDKEQYFERASRLVLLSHYHLEDKEAVAREWETYTSTGGKAAILEDILRWLGESYEKSGDAAEEEEVRKRELESAAKYLRLLTQREDAKPDDFLRLGRVQLRLAEHKGAVEALEAYLKLIKDPLSRASGLLLLGEAQIGLKEPAAAQKSVDEALQLQPDGIVNGKARILAGKVEMSRNAPDKAAKIFESVSVVIDDESVTPVALELGVEAYRSAGEEADAKRLLNLLQSRYPEYSQRRKL